MLFKKALFFSLVLHGFLLVLLFSFPYKHKPKTIGTVSILNTHLVDMRILSKQQLLSKQQSLEHQHKIKNKLSVHKKNGIENDVQHVNNHKKQVLSSFKKKGGLNSLMVLLHNLISQKQHYPQTAVLLEQQGSIEIGFILYPNGQIKNIQVLHSSHHDLLDKAALQAVQAINPVLNARTYLHQKQEISVWVRFRR